MRMFFVFGVVAACFGLMGCSSGGGRGPGTTSTTGGPTTPENVRPEYKKAGLGQGQPFTSEEEAIKNLPPGYPRPGDESQ